MNVTAGIGVLGQASAMSQEMFPGRVTAAAAGGFVGLLSIFNMAGRFFWASTSDYIGRKNTYFVFFALGTVLYALVPYSGAIGSISLSCSATPSSSACMVVGLRRCQRICATCSAHAMSGQSTYYY
jgi:MFS family permease